MQDKWQQLDGFFGGWSRKHWAEERDSPAGSDPVGESYSTTALSFINSLKPLWVISPVRSPFGQTHRLHSGTDWHYQERRQSLQFTQAHLLRARLIEWTGGLVSLAGFLHGPRLEWASLLLASLSFASRLSENWLWIRPCKEEAAQPFPLSLWILPKPQPRLRFLWNWAQSHWQ